MQKMHEEEYSFVILQKENMNLREKGKMKRTIYTIKRYQKLKEPIKLRFKKLVNGNLSLYLDSYYQGCRTYLFLHLYIIPEIDDIRLLQFVEQYANDRKKPDTEKYHGRYATIVTLMRPLDLLIYFK